ncbi:hypothetical protein EIP86_010685 [Pleurotus ostreatoroseus]|nr:hypothetical protein EIP86_010685 [Pleurotus ostreatoroseus]
MDFVWASALRHFRGIDPFTTYDIVCHWLLYLEGRITELPPEYHPSKIPGFEQLMWAIGKLHWYSHKAAGHSRYSLNFIPGAARSDGEGIERRWWVIQPITNSTKMMGPGSRQGTLNDQFGFMNWRNLVKLGDSLCKKYLEAHKNASAQEADFDAFSKSIDAATMKKWEKSVLDWEKDLSQPDPYINEDDGPSESSVRRKLAEEEEERVRTGKKIALHDVSPSAFLTIGLELEEQQRHLRSETSKENSVKIFESRTTLTRRILRFREVQSVYMPMVPRILASGAEQYLPPSSSTPSSISNQLIENSCLLLPSDLLRPCRASPSDTSPDITTRKATARKAIVDGLADGLIDQELQMRVAQCNDSLNSIRTKIQMRTGLHQYKRINVRHQGPNTRARGLMESLERRIRQGADKYRAAREALFSLTGGGGDWDVLYKDKYLELKSEDLRAMEDDDPTAAHRKKKQRTGVGEGRRTVSWIWRGAEGTDALAEGVRIEWLKARARIHRWKEELRLLPEELRRSVAFLQWKAADWDKRGALRQDVSPALQAGLRAYAAEQAAMHRGLASQFSNRWQHTKALIELGKTPAGASAAKESTGVGESSEPVPRSQYATRAGTANNALSDPERGNDADEENEADDEAGVLELGEDEADIAYLELDDVLASL